MRALVRAAAVAAFAFAGALVLGGCASRGPLGSATLADEIRLRGFDPATIIVPFEISAEMYAWLEEEIRAVGTDESRLDFLLRVLVGRSAAGELIYDAETTGTAAEVFASRRANCLGFTHLFIGMARAAGLETYYLRVYDLESFRKDGDLVVVSAHVTAAWGPPAQRRILDFTDLPIREYKQIEPISDLTAVALHYSNRGAEALRGGDLAGALVWLETAVRLDPELADAWVNLGVAERRSGRFAVAEEAYRRALEADSGQLSAYQNLAALLRILNRPQEANALLALTDRAVNRNPYSFIALGDLALEESRLAEAERFFRKALRLDPASAEAQAAVGQWELRSGDRRDARRWLRRAEQIDPSLARVQALARALAAPVKPAAPAKAESPSGAPRNPPAPRS